MSALPSDNLDLKQLQQQLQQALSLIEQSKVATVTNVIEDRHSLRNTQSLLERCEQVVATNSKNKPVLRIVHHFACSGGTLISKCLAAQPNVFLLSELHPFSSLHLGNYKAKFLPTDIIGQARYAKVPDIDSLAADIFVDNVTKAEKHVRNRGGYLVVRAHSHSDYCVGDQTVEKESFQKLLGDIFEIKQVVTLRDPVDSYRSLVENNWLHFSPATFDEYCRRLLVFLQQFKPEQIFSYEKFTHSPQTQLDNMLSELDLPGNDSFDSFFDLFNVSGDSGRSGNTIAPRQRKTLTPEYKAEIENSVFYKLYLASEFSLNGASID